MLGPRSSSPANMDVSVSAFATFPVLRVGHKLPPSCHVRVLALKQTQAVKPQIKAEAQAEASAESPEPVSTEVVQYGAWCEGLCEHSTPSSLKLGLGTYSCLKLSCG